MVDGGLKSICLLFLGASVPVLDWTINANESEV